MSCLRDDIFVLHIAGSDKEDKVSKLMELGFLKRTTFFCSFKTQKFINVPPGVLLINGLYRDEGGSGGRDGGPCDTNMRSDEPNILFRLPKHTTFSLGTPKISSQDCSLQV